MENIIIHNKTRDMLPSISSTILHVRYNEHANSKSVQSSPIGWYWEILSHNKLSLDQVIPCVYFNKISALKVSDVGTETGDLLWCQLCHHWHHWRLSYWQPSSAAMTVLGFPWLCLKLSIQITFKMTWLQFSLGTWFQISDIVLSIYHLIQIWFCDHCQKAMLTALKKLMK